MAYAIHGVELGQTEQAGSTTPTAPPRGATSTADWQTQVSNIIAQATGAGAQGATTGLMTSLQNLLNPQAPAPVKTDYMQYVVPGVVVLGLGVLAWSQMKKKG